MVCHRASLVCEANMDGLLGLEVDSFKDEVHIVGAPLSRLSRSGAIIT